MAKKSVDEILPCRYLFGMTLRRLGLPRNVSRCVGGHKCPDLFELPTGDFAVIGTDVTAQLVDSLPMESGCGPDQRIVRVPRRTLIEARPDIPTTL